MQYFVKYSGIRFCPLKIKITQYPSGFHASFFKQSPIKQDKENRRMQLYRYADDSIIAGKGTFRS